MERDQPTPATTKSEFNHRYCFCKDRRTVSAHRNILDGSQVAISGNTQIRSITISINIQ